MSRTLALAALAAAAHLGCRTAAPGATGTPPGAPAAPATGIDVSLVDRAANPCDSFYQYACGRWLASAAIPPDKPMWNRSFLELRDRALYLLRDIAEADAAGKRDPADRYPEKVGDYWAACMDEEGIERRGADELRAAWAGLDVVQDAPTLARALASLHRQGVFPVFSIRSEPDARDARQVIGAVVQGGLGLPDRDYYLKQDPKAVELQQRYRAHVATMLRLAGVPSGAAAAQADAIYALERSMAEVQWSRAELRNPELRYNRIDLAGLERAVPGFPWPAYLAALGHGELTDFSTTTPRYLGRLQELLQTTPPSTWRAYLAWHLLAEMATARALPRNLSDERFAFQSRSFTGIERQEARWKHCALATDAALGEALGQAYVRRHFGEEAKAKTRQLVSDVEGAMGRDLDSLAWMDPATRARAHDKLSRIANKVGYPDAWRNYDALRVERGSFFRSLLAANAFEVNRQLEQIGKPLDRGEWRMSPPSVNAYYRPSLNEIVFPAGILQAPFFTRGAPDAVNYGAIGMVVGHELTHGFDDQGRKYDGLGDLSDWWSPGVGQEFERRAACVVRQYQGYVAVDDLRLDGKLTLGENIADLGGLKLAYAAYRASRAGKPPEPPVAGFTPEQAFFLGHAQAWCTAIRPEYARLRVVTDPHSPARWRVDGPLSNLLEFRRAFACPDGSPMARVGSDRCEVW